MASGPAAKQSRSPSCDARSPQADQRAAGWPSSPPQSRTPGGEAAKQRRAFAAQLRKPWNCASTHRCAHRALFANASAGGTSANCRHRTTAPRAPTRCSARPCAQYWARRRPLRGYGEGSEHEISAKPMPQARSHLTSDVASQASRRVPERPMHFCGASGHAREGVACATCTRPKPTPSRAQGPISRPRSRPGEAGRPPR